MIFLKAPFQATRRRVVYYRTFARREETSLSRPETDPFLSETQETKDVAQGAALSSSPRFGEKGLPQSGVERSLSRSSSCPLILWFRELQHHNLRMFWELASGDRDLGDIAIDDGGV